MSGVDRSMSSDLLAANNQRKRKCLREKLTYAADRSKKNKPRSDLSDAAKDRIRKWDRYRYHCNREAKLREVNVRYFIAKQKRKKAFFTILRQMELKGPLQSTCSPILRQFTKVVEFSSTQNQMNVKFGMMSKSSKERLEKRIRNWKAWVTGVLKAGILKHNDSVRKRVDNGTLVPLGEAHTIVERTLNLKKEVMKLFSANLATLLNICKVASQRLASNGNPKESDAQEVILETVYGGKRYHVSSAEIYSGGERPWLYIAKNHLLSKEELEQPSSVWARECSDCCIIPEQWGSRIHKAMNTIDQCQPLHLIQEQIIRLEDCPKCNHLQQAVDYPECELGDSCGDLVKLIRKVAPHFASARTLLRNLYYVRELTFWICKCDTSLAIGDYKCLMALLTHDMPIEAKVHAKDLDVSEIHNAHSEQFVRERFAKQIAAFSKSCRLWPTQTCMVCRKWMENRKVKRLPFKADHDYAEGEKVCQFCWSYRKDGRESPTYIGNNMDVDIVPSVIADLNYYEKLLIQKAKTFQTLIRLKPLLHKGGDNDLVRAIRGCAVHLPLPIQETLNYTTATLPNMSMLDIIVDSLPLSKKCIWRSLVSLAKVRDALSWLKENNELYGNIDLSKWDLVEPPITLTETGTVLEMDERQAAASMLRHLGHTAVEIENITICQLQAKIPIGSDIEHYQLNKVETAPLPDKWKDLDCLAFPHLFPKGRFGMHQDRPIFVRHPVYQQSRLLNVDGRFRRDQQYLFHLFHNMQSRQIDSGIFACLRTSVSNESLTAGQLREKLSSNDQQLEARLSVMFAACTNTKEYWCRIAGDLAALDEKFGPATFFLTLSCAEYSWEDMREFLEFANSDVTNIKNCRIGSLCSNDPVSVAQQFRRRFQAFMMTVLMAKNGPLGEVEHYFWRLEYQARGAPHIHMKVWIKDAPIYGVASKETVSKFISDHITCQIPNVKRSPILWSLVDRFQRHVCGRSCQRLMKHRGSFFHRCRFGFPRPISDSIMLRTVEETVISRRQGGSKRLYDLQRSDSEQNINDYNALITLIWGANTDIQFVGETSMVLNRYISGYLTKHEKSSTEDLWACIQTLSDTNRSLSARLKSLACKSFASRECGAYEVADRLLGHSLHGSKYGDGVHWLGIGLKSQRKRKLRSKRILDALQEDDTNIYEPNWIDSYYPARPTSLETICLYEVFADYEYFTPSNRPNGNAGVLELQSQLGYLKKRQHPKVVKTPRFATKTIEGNMRYFHGLLMLFKPWRHESELLGNFESYQQAFELSCAELQATTKFVEARLRLERAYELAQRLKEMSIGNLTQNVDKPSEDDAMGKQPGTKRVTDEALLQMESQLNSGQRLIYDEIVYSLVHQQKHEDKRCICDQRPTPLRQFVSGVAGTGKSFLIELLRQKTSHKFDNDFFVITLAPTGIAAFNVSGTTIHRFFKLPVQHGSEKNFWQLSSEDAKSLRFQYSNIRLIIIDELSMVSNVSLTYIHLRLQQIFQVPDASIDVTFGNKNLVFFGDLLQLPPVRSLHVFMPLSAQQKLNCFSGLPLASHLWQQFQYYELTENMRQKEDADYAGLLNRVRIGSPTGTDLLKLRSRLIPNIKTLSDGANYLKKLMETDSNAVFLLPKNAQVDCINTEMLTLLGIQVVTIKAIDVTKSGIGAARSKSKSNGKCGKPKTSETAGLEDVLLLGVNVRVMLRRNIDVENGLVNGAIGVITDIKHSSETRVSTIMIQFGKNTPVAITRITSEFFMKGIIVTRSQFPVSVSYAITIHKSQGLTLSSVIVSIDSDCKEPAMVYVALSRVARLSSAHLTSFEPAAIGCDQAAFVEYSRCRQTFNKFASAGNRPLLPSLPMCNTMSNEIMKERSQLFKIVSDRNIVTKLFAALKPAPEVVDCSQPVSFLPLVNTDGVSCYANSLVQILLRIPQFISKMNEECTDNATVASLHLILAAAIRGNNIGDTWPLRRSIGNPFNAPQQQDVGHFWLRILELLPSESKSRFYFQLKQILTCSKCQLHKEPTVESMSQLNFYCQDKSQSFAELYKESIADSTVYADCSRRCSKPGKPPVKTPHVLRQEIIFPHFHRHLVISLSIFQQQGPLLARLSHRKITNFTSTCVKLGPREFSTVGAVCHKGATTTSGHYTATAREDAHWLKLNDTMCTTSKRFIPNLADVCLLFLTVK